MQTFHLANDVSLRFRPNGFGLPIWDLELPAGLRVIPADNLPGNDYWLAEAPDGVSEEVQLWIEEYGIRIDAEDVEAR
jgi:hypothetical protein